MLPLARAHSADGTAPHEPWAFGAECEATCRVAISRRYRLLPELYSLFRRAHQTGTPVVRPLFYAAPTDLSLRNDDSGFLIGDDLLVLTPPDYFSETVLPEAERDALEAAALAKRDAAIKNGTARSAFGGLIDPDDPEPLAKMGPLSTDPDLPDAHRAAENRARIAARRQRHADAARTRQLDSARRHSSTTRSIAAAPTSTTCRASGCAAAAWSRSDPVLQSTANIISNEYIADVVVALAARPRATAYGVIYEDDGDGNEHQRSGRYRETTYHAEVQDTIDEIIIQRRVSGGGADYAQFAQVRVFCFLGNGPAVIGRLDAGDDTLTIVMPPMSGFSLSLPSLASGSAERRNCIGSRVAA
jgi:hypothetical protein